MNFLATVGSVAPFVGLFGTVWGIMNSFFQIGAQQYAHALFFMTEKALADFRRADGWELGADARYALPDGGGAIGTDTTTTLAPVVVQVFGQSGLIVGASLAGTKYTRIIP